MTMKRDGGGMDGAMQVCQHWLGRGLDKTEQISDWDRRPLTPEQARPTTSHASACESRPQHWWSSAGPLSGRGGGAGCVWQVTYAALDAWALTAIFDQAMKVREGGRRTSLSIHIGRSSTGLLMHRLGPTSYKIGQLPIVRSIAAAAAAGRSGSQVSQACSVSS